MKAAEPAALRADANGDPVMYGACVYDDALGIQLMKLEVYWGFSSVSPPCGGGYITDVYTPNFYHWQFPPYDWNGDNYNTSQPAAGPGVTHDTAQFQGFFQIITVGNVVTPVMNFQMWESGLWGETQSC